MIDDDIQRAAATSDAAQVLVIAPPGCGKTELLAMRAEALIPRLRPNQRILALTFSNRARDNLAERMRTHLGTQRFRRFVRVRNFHGHATEIITAHCRTVGLDPEFILPTKQLLDRALRARTTTRTPSLQPRTSCLPRSERLAPMWTSMRPSQRRAAGSL